MTLNYLLAEAVAAEVIIGGHVDLFSAVLSSPQITTM